METIVALLRGVAHSEVALLALTVAVYYGAQLLYQRFSFMLLNPIIVSSAVIISILNLCDITFEQYYEANSIINFTLNLSVVALSYLMHKNIKRITEYKLSLIISTLCGSIIGVASVILLSKMFGCEDIITLSLTPKSITSAIALSLSDNIGGIPAITALAVVVTGIFGSVVGPSILRLCQIDDPVARGAAMGAASHAVGTARALEMGAIEGAVGGAAICLMGLFTSIMLPFITAIFV